MKRETLLIIFFFALLFIIMVVGVQKTFTSIVPGANDFIPRYEGARLYWQDGVDPYSVAATETIQRAIYGRLATPEEDQVLFVYPFYTVFMLLPLVWLPVSYSWIQAIWLVAVMFALIGAIFLIIKLLDWQLPPWLLALTLLWAIIFYNNTRTIILGQFAAFILLWLAAALLALKYERDVWAGALLALTTIKPQMTFLLIAALFIWAVGQRRWRFMAGFAGGMALLAGLSFILQPNWLFSFVDQVVSYPGYTFTGSPLWVITGYFYPQLGKPVEWLLGIILVGYMLFEWRHLWRTTAVSSEFIYILGITMIVTNMILVRTATTNYIVMYIPILLLLKMVAQSGRFGQIWVAVFYVVSIISLWLLFIFTIQGDTEHPIMYLPLPFLLLMALIIGRKRLTAVDHMQTVPV